MSKPTKNISAAVAYTQLPVYVDLGPTFAGHWINCDCQHKEEIFYEVLTLEGDTAWLPMYHCGRHTTTNNNTVFPYNKMLDLQSVKNNPYLSSQL